MREIKFKAWDKVNELMSEVTSLTYNNINQQLTILNKKGHFSCLFCDVVLMQYTGLKDKNGVEIYEYMELDNTYEVSFLNGSYVLTNISNGDIMLLSNYMENNNGKVEITREYTKV